MTSEDDAFLDLDAMFPEPDRPPTPPPTFSTYTRHISGSDLKDIRIRLVGSHPLWAHHLWNASRSFAAFLDQTRFCESRTTLELGAGGALPSIIAALTGSTTTVITDYPDQPLLANILYNVSQNVPLRNDRVFVTGYIWGQNTTPLLKLLSEGRDGFDVIMLSDLIFNHSQHDALLDTCEQVLSSSPGAAVFVFYSHHRPHLAHRDMEFFDKARRRGWSTDKIVEETYPPMFPDDPGDEAVRSTVHGWKLTYNKLSTNS
ncbi:hypothetical protein AGABI1DRAFT_77552 [Agaricus bisporus var. burnettii JB137-S8]|uniref:Protein N-terminal and lysine N-methyltransferase EFM7 n=1 Tax=Agaricus bisporus var. burnettii (strain JB137-S8 / ATCC MYA-4627 / FGSC 10392) TaxID=597362 RepID=K5VRR6_AGABU|nr:uncharacterized protein AGABI1DRAFT_77552 [Agaricus bisporus var. burnettii JB137-S8]EKM77139.1 hypothetical protein AGABI1DRAFT_77552 [Agaricus bisporus var. burnettii JB137-S8]